MSIRRELFRVEELTGMRVSPRVVEPEAEAALRHAEIMTELRALSAAVGALARPQAAPAFVAEPAMFRSELGSIYDAV